MWGIGANVVVMHGVIGRPTFLYVFLQIFINLRQNWSRFANHSNLQPENRAMLFLASLQTIMIWFWSLQSLCALPPTSWNFRRSRTSMSSGVWSAMNDKYRPRWLCCCVNSGSIFVKWIHCGTRHFIRCKYYQCKSGSLISRDQRLLKNFFWVKRQAPVPFIASSFLKGIVFSFPQPRSASNLIPRS